MRSLRKGTAVVLSSALVPTSAVLPSDARSAESWRIMGKESFLDFLMSAGCEDCRVLWDEQVSKSPPFALSSQHFGCADVDVLLPTLHWIYQATRRRLDGALPGILVDGGANVGRATARWFSSFGDGFGRRMARNATQAPCIICAGAEATEGGGSEGASGAPPSVVVVAVEPSSRNFALLRRNSEEHHWDDEGFLAINAALGDATGEGSLAVNEDFAVDELATLLPSDGDKRDRIPVRILTLEDVVAQMRREFERYVDLGDGEVWLLKLDIEGMEPSVLKTLGSGRVPVKFVSFEYAGNVWQEPLGPVIESLFNAGYVCFLVTSERLFPVSGPFWDPVYAVPIWSNFFCGRDNDGDVQTVVQLHRGLVGVWPAVPHTYLTGYASDDSQHYTLHAAQHRCMDLEGHCAGVTCECSSGRCVGPGLLPPSAYGETAPRLGVCTVRAGVGGLRRSPDGEVSFLRDVAAGDVFLAYKREQLPRETFVWA